MVEFDVDVVKYEQKFGGEWLLPGVNKQLVDSWEPEEYWKGFCDNMEWAIDVYVREWKRCGDIKGPLTNMIFLLLAVQLRDIATEWASITFTGDVDGDDFQKEYAAHRHEVVARVTAWVANKFNSVVAGFTREGMRNVVFEHMSDLRERLRNWCKSTTNAVFFYQHVQMQPGIWNLIMQADIIESMMVLLNVDPELDAFNFGMTVPQSTGPRVKALLSDHLDKAIYARGAVEFVHLGAAEDRSIRMLVRSFLPRDNDVVSIERVCLPMVAAYHSFVPHVPSNNVCGCIKCLAAPLPPPPPARM